MPQQGVTPPPAVARITARREQYLLMARFPAVNNGTSEDTHAAGGCGLEAAPAAPSPYRCLRIHWD